MDCGSASATWRRWMRRRSSTSSPPWTLWSVDPARPSSAASTRCSALPIGQIPSWVRMARLIYSAISSLDGYVEDRGGTFDWAAPDEEVHQFVNDLERPVSTYLYGRRMYETMVFWETAHTLADQSPVMLDFARLWQAADKVVYSRTLETVSSARTRIER